MAPSPSLGLLERALDETAAIISRVRPEQAGLPTPCPDFDIRTLINHLVFDLQVFTAGVTGAERGSPDIDLIGDDWSGAYASSRSSLVTAWRLKGTDGTFSSRLGVMPSTWAVGQHLADVAVHGWDIAKASGQSTELDPEVGRVALQWAHENLKPEYRGQAFGVEVEIPENAPIYERLAGYFGRNPF